MNYIDLKEVEKRTKPSNDEISMQDSLLQLDLTFDMSKCLQKSLVMSFFVNELHVSIILLNVY